MASKQAKIKFCRTFGQFIQQHDADAVQSRALRGPNVTLLKQVGWYGLLGFEFSVAVQLCI